jgi:hypothetical protein
LYLLQKHVCCVSCVPVRIPPKGNAHLINGLIRRLPSVHQYQSHLPVCVRFNMQLLSLTRYLEQLGRPFHPSKFPCIGFPSLSLFQLWTNFTTTSVV